MGRTRFVWTDTARNDPWDPQRKRELEVFLWYPTKAKEGRAAEYVPHLAKLSGISSFESAVLRNVKIDVLDSPPPSEGPFQVLLFSPGAGMPCAYYAGLIEDLVSRGYAVAAVEPTYEGAGQVLGKDRVATNFAEKIRVAATEQAHQEHFQKRFGVRAADLSFVLTQIEGMNRSDPIFKGKFRCDRAGVFGHSLGGQAAALAAIQDHRFSAGANLDGLDHGLALPISTPRRGMVATFLHLGKPLRELTDAELKARNMNQSEYRAAGVRLRSRADAALNEVKSGALRVTVDFATHQSFSDDPFLDPRRSKTERDVMPITRQVLADFFDACLRDRPAPQLVAGSPQPGVHIEVFGSPPLANRLRH